MEEKLLIQRLATITNTDSKDWFVLFRARSAMQVVFETLAACYPDKTHVATQTFTCVSAINPILDAGLTPYYFDISPNHFAIDGDKLSGKALRSCSALVLQHTFGIFAHDNAQSLQELAHREGLLLIEDSAHALGRMMEISGQKIADISIHSFGSEKLLPTKHGAAIWVNPQLQKTAFGQALLQSLQAVPPAPAKVATATAKYLWQIRFLAHLPAFLANNLKKYWLRRGKFYPPIILPQETSGEGTPYPPYKMPQPAIIRALELLKDYENMLEKRAANCKTYVEILQPHLVLPAALLANPDTPLVRFPLVYSEAEALIAHLRAQGFKGIGNWYRPALFPGVANPEKYAFDPDMELLPESKKAVQGIVNLPTDLAFEQSQALAQEIINFISGEK